jgi:hypothetical protein
MSFLKLTERLTLEKEHMIGVVITLTIN